MVWLCDVKVRETITREYRYFRISLPEQFVKSANLKDGDMLEVSLAKDGALVIEKKELDREYH